tara:strand:- start:238 stop:402 length:165 start_codon:yes stop_codon:yes gene_type:complete
MPARAKYRESGRFPTILAESACKSDIGDPNATPFVPSAEVEAIPKNTSSIANPD